MRLAILKGMAHVATIGAAAPMVARDGADLARRRVFYDANCAVRVIHVLLGPAALTTTAQCDHVATMTICGTVSPYESLARFQDQTVKRSLE